ncbi:MAG: hypothetical protein NXI22_18525 [bacterium]|nr:hypothetical protein [bacterium]
MHSAAPLSAALAEPDQSAGLQILADWYEEQGDARAEILRICVQLRSLSAADPLRETLMSRLWAKNNFWLGYRRRKETDIECHLTLGDQESPFSVHVSASEMLREGDQFATKIPATYPLCINGEADDFKQLAESQILTKVVSLGPTNSEDSAADGVFFTSPHVAKLRNLAIHDERAFHAVAKSPHLENVVSFKLSLDNDFESPVEIQDASLLRGLKRFELSEETAPDDRLIGAISRLLAGGRLTSLLLPGEAISLLLNDLVAQAPAGGLTYLSAARQTRAGELVTSICGPVGERLQRLDLMRSFWSDQQAVDRLTELPKLQSLILSHSHIVPTAAEAFARQPLAKLQYLDLSHSGLKNEGLRHLAEGKPWPALETLLIHQTGVTTEGMPPLIDRLRATFPRLKRLVAGPFQSQREWSEKLAEILPNATIVPSDLPPE